MEDLDRSRRHLHRYRGAPAGWLVFNHQAGNSRFQYYETICGGAGARPDFDGASAVHTHMTNTRVTDPEELELRCPVRLARKSPVVVDLSNPYKFSEMRDMRFSRRSVGWARLN